VLKWQTQPKILGNLVKLEVKSEVSKRNLLTTNESQEDPSGKFLAPYLPHFWCFFYTTESVLTNESKFFFKERSLQF